MINAKKITRLAAAVVMFAPAAFANGFPNVVHNSNSNVVRNTFDNCVISSFNSMNDECTGVYGTPDIHNLSKEWRNVYFDFNKSTLNAREKAKLDSLSKVIVASKEVKNVDLTGYADVAGNAAYNKRLSLKRAQTVKSYLAAKGLKTRKVKLEGLGESKPLTDCGYTDGKKATKEQISCMSEDRRVEIMLNFIK